MSKPSILRASNGPSTADTVLRAFCLQLPDASNAGQAPDWIPYFPAPDATGRITGEDGRWWVLKDPKALCAAVKRKLPIDINHSTEIAAKAGGESPAAGWMHEFQVRDDGSTWAKAKWNARGSNALAAEEYGFISPTFDFDAKTRVITRLVSAALLNEPNFTSLALNASGSRTALADLMNREIDKRVTTALTRNEIVERLAVAAGIDHGTVDQILRGDIEVPPIERLRGFARVLELNLETLMDALPASAMNHEQLRHLEKRNMTLEQLLALLGLAPTASLDDATRAINALKSAEARASNAPDLTRYVPRSDHDLVVTRATNAEAALAKVQEKAKAQQIDSLIGDALKAGKITPASEPAYRAMCAREGGVETFTDLMKVAPVIVGEADRARNAPEASADGLSLTDSQRAICAATGMDPKAYAASLKALTPA